MSGVPIAAAVVIGVLVLLVLAAFTALARFYRKVPQGQALIVNKTSDVPAVTFTGAVVLPIIHKAEIMDISVQTIGIDRRGRDGLICADNIRADIKVTFFIEVQKTSEAVLEVARKVGTARATDPEKLDELFQSKFAEALKTAGRHIQFTDLYTQRQEFRDSIVEIIGRDLNGYLLSDVAIDYLEQTPLSSMDPQNILDAQGIKLITELTAREAVFTNELRNDERKAIKRKDVETQEALLELERQEADATARQQREVQSVQAREEAAAEIVRNEERLRSESARIATDQQVAISEENMHRELDVAEQNRLRVLAVEQEKVTRAKDLEVLSREAETTAARRAIETELAGVAEVAERRVVAEKAVAAREEEIATLRVVEQANRTKTAVVTDAEAEAQAGLVRDIKAAEAAEQAAAHRAKEQVTLAQAGLESANLTAQADIRRAEGVKATQAAPGLAAVEVRQADAAALEKEGLAEVAVKTAEAGAVRELGAAEGDATRARIAGEAAGLTERADALKAINEAGREHEEFRMRVEADVDVRKTQITAEAEVGKAQAEAMGLAMSSAKVNIVGGTDMFVDRIMGATARGHAFDAGIEGSEHGRTLLAPYLDGSQNLVSELSGALAGAGPAGLQNLTVSALLTKLMANGNGSDADLSRLLKAVAAAGIADQPVGDALPS